MDLFFQSYFVNTISYILQVFLTFLNVS